MFARNEAGRDIPVEDTIDQRFSSPPIVRM